MARRNSGRTKPTEVALVTSEVELLDDGSQSRDPLTERFLPSEVDFAGLLYPKPMRVTREMRQRATTSLARVSAKSRTRPALVEPLDFWDRLQLSLVLGGLVSALSSLPFISRGYIALFVILVMWIVGGGLAYYLLSLQEVRARRSKWRLHRLAVRGVWIEAGITMIVRSQDRAGVPQWHINCQGFLPRSESRYAFQSVPFPTDPTGALSQRSITTLPVCVDRKHPKNYYVDAVRLEKLLRVSPNRPQPEPGPASQTLR
jgi:hypothetical protein